MARRTTNLADLDDAALVESIAEKKEELFKLRFQLATGQLTNTTVLKTVKRDIARALTEHRARQISAAEAK